MDDDLESSSASVRLVTRRTVLKIPVLAALSVVAFQLAGAGPAVAGAASRSRAPECLADLVPGA